MQARVWGCRGSLATPGPTTVRTGGNTSCLEVRTPSRLIVLDAGTGIRNLGDTVDERRIDLLLTHLHLDHVEGLGFFAPLFDGDAEITIWGPRPSESTGLRGWLTTYLSPPFFPVPFDTLPARLEVNEVGAEEWSIDSATVQSSWVKHPGPTLAYRIEHAGATLAYIPDNELGAEPESGAAVAAGADVLFHDAQYTAEEYAMRVGWGHSGLPDFGRFVRGAAAARVLMFHHDPWHDDAQLEEMVGAARALAEQDVELAREGLVVSVAASRDSH
jgi:phosphoribosyl 1,2-cyclic phosphodiesterase